MADKAKALQSFWSSFGWDAIDEISSYDEDTMKQLGITFPYISYEVALDDFESPVAIGADLWDRSSSWVAVTEKALAIEQAIGLGGVLFPCDGGAIWITRGSPFSRRIPAESGYDVRRVHININAEFITA